MNKVRIAYEGVKQNKGINELTFPTMKKYIEELQKIAGKGITYLEIGVQFGGTFKKILQLLRPIDKAIGIDLFETYPGYTQKQTHGHFYAHREDVENILLEMGFSKEQFTLITGDSEKTIQGIDDIKIGYAFIDANHTFQACKTDTELAIKKIDKGVFHLHDTDRKEWGCGRVAEQLVSEMGLQFLEKTHDSHFFSKGLDI